MSTRAVNWAQRQLAQDDHVGGRPRRVLLTLAVLADDVGRGEAQLGLVACAARVRRWHIRQLLEELRRRGLLTLAIERADRDAWLAYALPLHPDPPELYRLDPEPSAPAGIPSLGSVSQPAGADPPEDGLGDGSGPFGEEVM